MCVFYGFYTVLRVFTLFWALVYGSIRILAWFRVFKTVENSEISDSFAEICTKDHRNTHAALYSGKTTKKHVLLSGNSSPSFSGGVKHVFFSFSGIRSIVRGRLEGGVFKSVKTGQKGVKTVKNPP